MVALGDTVLAFATSPVIVSSSANVCWRVSKSHRSQIRIGCEALEQYFARLTPYRTSRSAIRAKRLQGVTFRQLARDHGTTVWTIHKLCSQGANPPDTTRRIIRGGKPWEQSGPKEPKRAPNGTKRHTEALSTE